MEPKQSLESQIQQLFSQEKHESDNVEIKTPLLKIVNNTIVFDNTVYQIRNISTVAFSNLKRKRKNVPQWYWFLLGLGVILIAVNGIGFLIVFFVVLLFQKHNELQEKRTKENYGLRIKMNSGEEVILVSEEKDFVLRVVLTIHNIMNSDQTENVIFDFQTRHIYQIEDKSIHLGNSSNSTVVSGNIDGDVVNNV